MLYFFCYWSAKYVVSCLSFIDLEALDSECDAVNVVIKVHGYVVSEFLCKYEYSNWSHYTAGYEHESNIWYRCNNDASGIMAAWGDSNC